MSKFFAGTWSCCHGSLICSQHCAHLSLIVSIRPSMYPLRAAVINELSVLPEDQKKQHQEYDRHAGDG